MRAIVIREPGGPDVLEWHEVPDPEPGPGEALVDVVASAVNRVDLLQRAGFYDPPPGTSPYPGLECSGRIAALGAGVVGWHVGQEVCALLAGGGYAEKVAVPAGQLLPVPTGLVESAALPEAACTVWSNLVGAGHLLAGETLLVHGGGSGVGTFAVQYARTLGARVFATARAAKHDGLRELGAELLIDYTTEDFVEAVLAATGGQGVDVILDIVGGPYLGRNLAALAVGGRLVEIGLQGGRKGELDLGMLLGKRATVVGTTLRSRPAPEKADIVSGVRAAVWPQITSAQITPVIAQRYPMAEAAHAHRLAESDAPLGKLLLVVE